jgi:succinate dehydrogenase/fumarate reductase-like Fe-S protein
MIRELFISLFRFNHQTDYLPYYKKYTVDYLQEETVGDLLGRLCEIETFSFEPSSGFGVKINGLFVTTDAKLASVVDRVGADLKIEPLSLVRVYEDLMIDPSDCIQKVDIFKVYITDEQRERYIKELTLTYYASNTLNFNRDYIGDHALVIANDIIERDAGLQDAIMAIVTDRDSGIWYHTSLKNRLMQPDERVEKAVAQLRSMLPEQTVEGEVDSSQLVDAGEITQYFTDFNIASYDGVESRSIASVITASGANYVDIVQKCEDLARSALSVDRDFTYAVAGEILLEAKDKGSDFFIVPNQQDLQIFDGNQRAIESVVGRDIELPVITRHQYAMLLAGEKDTGKLGFKNHKIKINFL